MISTLMFPVNREEFFAGYFCTATVDEEENAVDTEVGTRIIQKVPSSRIQSSQRQSQLWQECWLYRRRPSERPPAILLPVAVVTVRGIWSSTTVRKGWSVTPRLGVTYHSAWEQQCHFYSESMSSHFLTSLKAAASSSPQILDRCVKHRYRTTRYSWLQPYLPKYPRILGTTEQVNRNRFLHFQGERPQSHC